MDNSTNLIISNILLSTLRDRYNELGIKNFLSYLLWILLTVGILILLIFHFAYKPGDIPGSFYIALIPIFLSFWSISMTYLQFKIREVWLYITHLEKQVDDLMKALIKDKPEYQKYQTGYFSWAELRKDYFGNIIRGKEESRKQLRINIYLVVFVILSIYIFAAVRGGHFLLETNLISLNLLVAIGYVTTLVVLALLAFRIFTDAKNRLKEIEKSTTD